MTDLDRALQRARNEMIAERFGRVADRAVTEEMRDHGRFQVGRTERARADEPPYGYEPVNG